MGKTLIAAVSIMVAGMTLIFFIHSSYNRFAIVTANNGQTYEVDKQSGRTWLIDGKKKIPVEDIDAPRPILEESEMSAEELSKISAEARLSKGTLLGKIYNGTDIPLTRVILTVTAKEPDGTVRWTRDFTDGTFVKPMTTGHFNISVTDGDDLGEVTWTVTKAFTRPLTNKSIEGR
ncbi:MAG: hypothetical protein A2X84_11910 [Desulfuromonadaceae bacterium GWC2_58_13]|nr:MAG: hypothetical protein A2X84_11910 [Desulfuromonadaceae bacterium GWC2_58_13]